MIDHDGFWWHYEPIKQIVGRCQRHVDKSQPKTQNVVVHTYTENNNDQKCVIDKNYDLTK